MINVSMLQTALGAIQTALKMLLKNRWMHHLLYTEIVYDESIILLDPDASEHKVNLTLKGILSFFLGPQLE